MTQKLPNIRNITVSGRIGTGTTTLAKKLSKSLGWELLEGGELFEKFFDQEKGEDSARPDSFDLEYEKKITNLLKNKNNQIIQSHLAGFDAQNIKEVFKILVICEDKKGKDLPQVRAKRLAKRKSISQSKALREVKNREEANLKKWRRLYVQNNSNWVYWDKKYYNLIINTHFLNSKEALQKTLHTINSSI